ncbi:hypothetical protein K2Y11_23940 [bacterium]|nr:hypothetical protein [bacterium]
MSQSLEHIFLDMDGVIADFVTMAVKLHGRADVLENWPNGERDIPNLLNSSRGEYWKLIDAQGADFWCSISPFPWLNDLVSMVREFAPMTVLTKPSLSPACAEGKIRWLYKQFPPVKGRRFSDFLIGSRKDLLANPRRVLVDDDDDNAEKFRKAGGCAIVFPQPWNSNFAVENRLDYVREQLNQFAWQ